MLAVNTVDDDFKFSSPAAAVQWAEEMALRDGVKSPLAELQKVDMCYRAIGNEDAKMLAFTISAAVSKVSPHIAGKCYRAIYGGMDMQRDYDVSRELALGLDQRYFPLAGAILSTERIRLNTGRRAYSREIARRAGVVRQTLVNWHDVRAEMTGRLAEWIDTAERQLTVILTEKGVL